MIVSELKPLPEILGYLDADRHIFLVGCRGCAEACQTGGEPQVLEMKEKLEASGKKVVGWMVLPTACDELTKYALEEKAGDIEAAGCILAMTCAIGVQVISFYLEKPKSVYPALNTMFLGVEDSPGHFVEVCLQCGSCVLGRTANICPLVRCAKSLLNGPCGGSSGGKCEISKDVPCAWQLIYDRLLATGRLDVLEEIAPVKDWSVSVSGGPRQTDIEAECGVIP